MDRVRRDYFFGMDEMQGRGHYFNQSVSPKAQRCQSKQSQCEREVLYSLPLSVLLRRHGSIICTLIWCERKNPFNSQANGAAFVLACWVVVVRVETCGARGQTTKRRNTRALCSTAT